MKFVSYYAWLFDGCVKVQMKGISVVWRNAASNNFKDDFIN